MMPSFSNPAYLQKRMESVMLRTMLCSLLLWAMPLPLAMGQNDLFPGEEGAAEEAQPQATLKAENLQFDGPFVIENAEGTFIGNEVTLRGKQPSAPVRPSYVSPEAVTQEWPVRATYTQLPRPAAAEPMYVISAHVFELNHRVWSDTCREQQFESSGNAVRIPTQKEFDAILLSMREEQGFQMLSRPTMVTTEGRPAACQVGYEMLLRTGDGPKEDEPRGSNARPVFVGLNLQLTILQRMDRHVELKVNLTNTTVSADSPKEIVYSQASAIGGLLVSEDEVTVLALNHPAHADKSLMVALQVNQRLVTVSQQHVFHVRMLELSVNDWTQIRLRQLDQPERFLRFPSDNEFMEIFELNGQRCDLKVNEDTRLAVLDGHPASFIGGTGEPAVVGGISATRPQEESLNDDQLAQTRQSTQGFSTICTTHERSDGKMDLDIRIEDKRRGATATMTSTMAVAERDVVVLPLYPADESDKMLLVAVDVTPLSPVEAVVPTDSVDAPAIGVGGPGPGQLRLQPHPSISDNAGVPASAQHFDTVRPASIRMCERVGNELQPQPGSTLCVKDGMKATVPPNDSITLTFPARLKTVEGFDSTIMAVSPVNPTQLRIEGLQQGTTRLTAITEDQEALQIIVMVQPSYIELESLIERFWPEADVEVVPVQNVILLRGTVPSAAAGTEIVQVAEQYAPKVLDQMTAIKGEATTTGNTKTADDLPASNTSLREEIRALHRDVLRLIELLQSKAALDARLRQSSQVTEAAMEALPDVVVYFRASWCRPCQVLDRELMAMPAPSVPLITVDIDDSPELAKKFGIDRVPIILRMKQGEVRAKSVGVVSRDQLADLFRPIDNPELDGGGSIVPGDEEALPVVEGSRLPAIDLLLPPDSALPLTPGLPTIPGKSFPIIDQLIDEKTN